MALQGDSLAHVVKVLLATGFHHLWVIGACRLSRACEARRRRGFISDRAHGVRVCRVRESKAGLIVHAWHVFAFALFRRP